MKLQLMLQKECGSLLLQGNHNPVFKMKKQISFLQQGCYCFWRKYTLCQADLSLWFHEQRTKPPNFADKQRQS